MKFDEKLKFIENKIDTDFIFYTGQIGIDRKELGIGRNICKEKGEEQIFEGMFKNGQMNGFGRMFYANGDVYMGEFKDHKLHGKGEYLYYYG